MEPLTTIEKDCLDLMEAYFTHHGSVPPVGFLANRMEMSLQEDRGIYSALERKGFLVRANAHWVLVAPGEDVEVRVESNGIRVFRLMEQELWRSGT